MVKDPVMRFATPEKQTYHLPKEDQHHDIEITFLEDILKDKKPVAVSEDVVEHLLSDQ